MGFTLNGFNISLNLLIVVNKRRTLMAHRFDELSMVWVCVWGVCVFFNVINKMVCVIKSVQEFIDQNI